MAPAIQQNQVSVNGISVNYAETGVKGNRAIIFLHGFPQTHLAFRDVMVLLRDKFHVIALDLPGVGMSWPIPSGDKKSIANFICDFIRHQKLDKVIVCGHDAGGMVAYSLMRNQAHLLVGAVIMNTAVPGVAPWEDVKRNPYIWHFSFFSIPTLPETLILGKERPLFDYFFDTLSADKKSITAQKRAEYTAAYQKPESLKTSLDWYRAFAQDEKDNSDSSPVDLPLLYIRGTKDFGQMDQYIKGFEEKGIKNLTTKIIDGSGHYAPDEKPAEVAAAIRDFAKTIFAI